MITTEKEKFYDENIAPKLVEIGKICQEHGISLVAAAEYDSGAAGQGLTACLSEDASISMRMNYMVAKSLGNVDNFIISLVRYLRKNNINHGSMILSSYLKPNASDRDENNQPQKQPAETNKGKDIRIAFID